MTHRSEFAHRRAELQARVMAHVVNRAFSTRTTGLDGLAKRMLARAAGGAKGAVRKAGDDGA